MLSSFPAPPPTAHVREAVKAEGGIILAQDASAKYDSMPRSAIAAGCVDFVLSPEQIGKELARMASHPFIIRSHGVRSVAKSSPKVEEDRLLFQRRDEQDGLKKILLLLRGHSGVDFSSYKFSTIYRRINRRVVLNKLLYARCLCVIPARKRQRTRRPVSGCSH